jgi:hypothetical protein
MGWKRSCGRKISADIETGRTERQSLCPAGGAKEGIIDFGNEEASTLRCSSGKGKILLREQCTSN